MSALLLGLTEKQREQAASGQSQSVQPPGTKPYIDGLLTLIPAEALALHAVMLEINTSSTSSVSGLGEESATLTPAGEPTDPGTERETTTATGQEQVVVTVDSRLGLQIGFVACIAITLFAYWLAHRRPSPTGIVRLDPRAWDKDPRDILRAVAVALAFIVWAFLTNSPMIDVVSPEWSWWTPRVQDTVAVLVAAAILTTGWLTAAAADRQQPA